jgi:hypothetical protein
MGERFVKVEGETGENGVCREMLQVAARTGSALAEVEKFARVLGVCSVIGRRALEFPREYLLLLGRSGSAEDAFVQIINPLVFRQSEHALGKLAGCLHKSPVV